MNTTDKQYTDLLQDILDNGVKKQDRTGTGTISVFGRQIRHDMKDGFPLLTTKKMPFKTIVTELLWFLRGDTNIKFLVDNNCHIWDGDAYKNYLKHFDEIDPIEKMSSGSIMIGASKPYIPFTQEEFIDRIKNYDNFGKKWGELGPIYGKQWRRCRNITPHSYLPSVYNETYIDQIQNLINDLKTNPDSRRLMVNAWNVGELDQMVLPPCHYGFQVYTRELSGDERWNLLEKKVGKELFDSWVSEIVPFGGGLSEYLQSHNIPKRAISLMWNQRSVDTFLGLPFNIASYGLLLEIIAKEVNMVPEELIGNLGDVHLYSNHLDAAKEQIGRELTWEEKIQWVMKNTDVELENFYITEAAASLSKRTREPFPLPTLKKLPDYLCIEENWECYEIDDIQVENYQSHPTIKAPLSN